MSIPPPETPKVAAPHVRGCRDRAREWIRGDPDPVTRGHLQDLVDTGDTAALVPLMEAHLRFGTAGLRGAVGPGPNRMNRAVVIRASRGLADHVVATDPAAVERGVVVGFDARPDSERFARDAVAVLRGAGLPVAWFPTPTPTPMIARAALVRDAAAAVVVTASHNPRGDNGFKVYDGHGVQISPPTDDRIAAAIDAVGDACDVPGVGRAVDRDPEVTPLGTDAEDDYLRAIATVRPNVDGDHTVKLVVTPMHGVGGRVLARALDDAGFDRVHRVPEQWEPDGTFPTVAFPNPEEPGALDLAISRAVEVDAAVVLAIDPDADRLGVAVPDESGWRRLSGDEVGCLLAAHLLGHTDAADPLVVSSIVSSTRVSRVAAAHGARHETTLTGFKWIWRAGRALAATTTWVLGYEEALGYAIGPVVRDKDGIAAAVVIAELAAMEAARGRTLIDALADLDRQIGPWATAQRSLRLEGADGHRQILAMMASATTPPSSLGRRTVQSVENLAEGADQRPPWMPASPVVIWHLDGGGRVLIRPSGTEPKLKVYADLPLRPDEPAAGAEQLVRAAEAALQR